MDNLVNIHIYLALLLLFFLEEILVSHNFVKIHLCI
jgi:hypothetical protein